MPPKKNSAKKVKDPTDTPMMRQFLAVKEEYPDAILFYRMGDFYEMFLDDAVVAAGVLDLTLTSRNKNDPNPIPMCGLPHHAALGYISRLIDSGYKVAVCEQMEDPTKVKGLVKREVIRVVTPGVVLDEENLETKANNFLVVVLPVDETGQAGSFAVVAVDVSTQEFKGVRLSGPGALAGELYRLEPREVLLPAAAVELVDGLRKLLPRCAVTTKDAAAFEGSRARVALESAIGPQSANEIEENDEALARAAGVAADYVCSTRPKDSILLPRFVTYRLNDFMIVDEATKSHLELTRTADGEKKGSLLSIIDTTRTPMGGRLLRQWVNYPLTDVAAIRRRLDRVELFFNDATFRGEVREALGSVADMERLAGRLAVAAATPRDLGVLRNSLGVLPALNGLISGCPVPDAAAVLGARLDCAEEVTALLARALVDEPPSHTRDGGIFREGYHPELDELRSTATHAKNFIAELEERERKRTGISSLKVSYNKVFGYFILITKSNLKSVPDDYVRKQTLTTGERFVTPELEEWEAKVLFADERQRELEVELYERLTLDLSAQVTRLLDIARRLAELDCASGLAHMAREREFVRPEVDDDGVIEIVEGRHPIVEALQPGTPFVPNDVHLDPARERLMIITGPNMAGKSTVMRQVAVLTILAQMGSFVPAERARVGVCDRVFTRVGASDNIARGASTFMVEMNETADILRHATTRSLVILDEVGRGTSTYDGLSIAWAVGEYLHDAVGCKVMFATHYHELVELAQIKEYAVNRHVAAREYKDEVVFLRKLVDGGTSHSFGIQVAKMAGLPEIVVQRSREVLRSLEEERPAPVGMPQKVAETAASPQLDLFVPAGPSEVERIIGEIDLDRLTPIEALALLSRLKEMV